MKIAVNTRLLLPNKLEGIGWFTYEILQRLCVQHPEVEWLFIFDRPYKPHFVVSSNVTPIVAPPQARHPLLWHLWLEYSLPYIFKKHKPDLFLSPDGYVSMRSKVKTLAVLHDINFEHFPEYIPKKVRGYFLKNFRRFAKRANRVATVSQYSKDDIVKTYGLNPNKIDLVYNGCGEFFKPLSDEEKNEVRQSVARGSDYFIFVGALNPRKNIDGMLQAYSKYRNNGGTNKFIIVGEKMFWNEQIQNVYENHPHQNDILFIGRLEGAALSRVLAASAALLFVSHFEGFGIPIVEAFKCQVPVITSNTTSMPEVAGKAALLCNPNDLEEIAQAMKKVSDPELREKLVNLGKERVELFTWQKSSEMMWESIQKTLAN